MRFIMRYIKTKIPEGSAYFLPFLIVFFTVQLYNNLCREKCFVKQYIFLQGGISYV